MPDTSVLSQGFASTMQKSLTYDNLYQKYSAFSLPRAQIKLKGKVFKDKQEQMVINDISIDLSSDYEASVAVFRIYNCFDSKKKEFRMADISNTLYMGASLEISLGYLHKFNLVFVGFVAGINFVFDACAIPYIEVTGMDAKGIMMANNYSMQLKAKSYSEAVKEILQRSAYQKLESANAITEIKISETPDKIRQASGAENASTIEMVAESDYEFIVKAAKKWNYEFFIDRGIVYFRKAKSNTAALIKLNVSQGIVGFNVGYSITGVVGSVEARAMDVGTGKLIRHTEKSTKNLSTNAKAKGIISKSKQTYIDPTILSAEDAKARAQYLVENMSYRLGSFECECVGIPELVPGRFIELSGLGELGDNDYYITRVSHEFNEYGGYRVKMSGKASEVKNELI